MDIVLGLILIAILVPLAFLRNLMRLNVKYNKNIPNQDMESPVPSAANQYTKTKQQSQKV
jgi:hypothetical protein